MSKIIKPNLRPIKKMEITLDASGQAEINTKNLLTGGALQPMEVVLSLLQISVSMLAAMSSNQTTRKVIATEETGNATKEKSH